MDDHDQPIEEVVDSVLADPIPTDPIPADPIPADSIPADAAPENSFLEDSLFDEPPRFAWRRSVTVVLLAVLADAAIYRGQGFAGLAALFAVGPMLLCLGVFRPQRFGDVAVVGVMLALLSARLVWCGSILQATLGFGLLAAFAMTLSALRPYVLEVVVFASQTVMAGYIGLAQQWQSARSPRISVTRIGWLNAALPVGAFIAFGMLFVLANPDLLSFISGRWQTVCSAFRDWVLNNGPSPFEVLFFLAAIWIFTGAIRPLMRDALQQESSPGGVDSPFRDKPQPAKLFPAFRNMLLTVIALFAAYLMFEFSTLWFREFPEGFYYSGYAHEGAFWLTVALALATAILSLVFRGTILNDPRQPYLRTLAWIWSVENLFLAATVYHRMMIYVGFNGMTRMRVIGFFGISAVVLGFLLVLIKIATERDFVWLVRRQLWALALTFFVYALTPVDMIVMQHNVRRIVAGDPAPSVQISVHSIDAEGVLQLPPLLDCQDVTIREGVRALLSERYESAQEQAARRSRKGWTAFQWSDALVLRRLQQERARLTDYASPGDRVDALEAFHDYAYRWY